MEKKTARLTILIDPDKKKALEELCLQQDVTPSGDPATDTGLFAQASGGIPQSTDSFQSPGR
nr:hypothetical protein [Serratia sp. PAMC26656]MBJ7890712.1 hypothetical protein [Serratia sp. PAMC26656]